MTYALSAQTKLGLLPEQMTADGEPAWVVPPAWSNAMLLLAARSELTWPDNQGLTLRDHGVTEA